MNTVEFLGPNAYYVKDLTDSRPVWFLKQIYNLIINGKWEQRSFRFQVSIPARGFEE